MHSVVVVSGIAIYREGIAAYLERQAEIDKVVASAGLDDVAGDFEICVLDGTSFDDESIAPFLLSMNRASTPVVVVGLPATKERVLDCLEAGASGYVTKDQSLDDLLATIKQTCAHGACLRQADVAAVLGRVRSTGARRAGGPGGARPQFQRLTAREREVAKLLTDSCSNYEIAHSLGISVHTVKHHVRSTLAKLGLQRRSEATALRGRIGALVE